MSIFRMRRGICRGASPAVGAVLIFLCISTAVSAPANPEPLTLAQASRLVLSHHPELAVFQLRLKAAQASSQTSALKPGYELGVSVENFAGNKTLSGISGAEVGLSLSSVIEMGGQRQARVALSDSQYSQLEARQEAKALDLLGQLTQSFLTALTLQRQLDVAHDEVALAESALKLVSQRVRRGAAPEAERLRARAVLEQNVLQTEALATKLEAYKYQLGLLMGVEPNQFDHLSGELFDFDKPGEFREFLSCAEKSPYIEVFASKARLQSAQLELIKSQSVANLGWSLGVRRFQESQEMALTASVSIPLFSESRSQGDLAAALAESQATAAGREVAMLSFKSRLYEAWQTYQRSAGTAVRLQETVLPLLEKALDQTRIAYSRGLYSYSDWISAQRELLEARYAAIEAASSAKSNQALVEQLTGQAMLGDSTTCQSDGANLIGLHAATK